MSIHDCFSLILILVTSFCTLICMSTLLESFVYFNAQIIANFYKYLVNINSRQVSDIQILHHVQGNYGQSFWGSEDGGNYCTDVYTAEKEDDFSEADANFEMMLYAYMAVTSASTFRAPTPSFLWGMCQKFTIQGIS